MLLAGSPDFNSLLSVSQSVVMSLKQLVKKIIVLTLFAIVVVVTLTATVQKRRAHSRYPPNDFRYNVEDLFISSWVTGQLGQKFVAQSQVCDICLFKTFTSISHFPNKLILTVYLSHTVHTNRIYIQSDLFPALKTTFLTVRLTSLYCLTNTHR